MADAAEPQQAAYAHPTAALFTVLFKVGHLCRSQWTMSQIPPAPFTDAAALLQAASFAVYILSGIFGLGFITTFVICIVSLMLDFWTVRC
jgi:Eukaryotic protein of unknown function (DUF846)